MTPEIKQRIEQIKNGEIPEGYKRTKAGIIPEKWEIKKLSDVLKKQTQKNTDNEIQNVLTNSATQGIVCQTEYFDKQIANNENTSGYYIVKPGYYVYNPRISVSAPCGPFNRYNGDKDGIMSPLYSVYCFCDKSITYANFLTYYFSSSKWYAYMNSIANYGARSDRMNVTREDMNNMPIPYPPLPEQQKIVAILSEQDKVIECYEKKIEQLKRMKKYYLQNMFPKRGETVPKIRFKGFTESWEQRKLGQISTFINGRAYSKSELLPNGKYKVLRVGNFYTNDSWYYSDLELGEKYYANFGDLLYTWSTTFGPHLWLGDKVIYHYHIWKVDLSDQLEKHFAIQLLEQDKNNIMSGKNGSTMVHITKEGMEQKEVIIPPDISEQAKIGTFFGRIDNLITLHQRKLEEEKKKKKALQQLLLTGIVRTN